MDRRSYLRALCGVGLASGVAGCGGFGLAESSRGVPPIPENRPDAVYYPSHVEGMEMVGGGSGGDYRAAVMYSYPHRFWNVNGRSVERTDIEPDDEIHLMASVWDPESGQVLPDTGLTIEIVEGDALVSQEVIYPMLSQPMGFHYGANFALDGDGDYAVRLAVGAVSTRRTGAFGDRFDAPATIEVPFEYRRSAREEISYRTVERAGERGAVEPMGMETLPDSSVPEPSALPGTVVGTATSGDAVLVATVLDAPPTGIDGDGAYLAVSARTPYNRIVLPAMGLSARLEREGTAAFEGELVRTLDPDLSYHYGAVVGAVRSGDELTLTPTIPPQTARHEGYETAFGGLDNEMTAATVAVEGR
jgi:uncharacterized protein involved in high-affinity Fe2+ transport